MNDQSKVDASTQRQKFWRRKNLARGLAAFGVVAGVATGTWAVEETVKLGGLGLRGIFPATAPAGLAPEEFAKLDGKWADWSKTAGEAVADFYAKLETADVAQQRAALKVLENKLDVMTRSINDPRYKRLLAPLTVLHSRLSTQIDLATAALDTLEVDPQKVRDAKLVDTSKNVIKAVADLRASLAKNSPWLPYVRADILEKGLAKLPASAETLTAAREAKERITNRASMPLPKQVEYLGRPAFLHLESALEKFLAIADAAPYTPNEPELRAQLKALLDSSDAFAASRSSEDAAKTRDAFKAIRSLAADGGDRIGVAMQRHLMNYNVRVVASEEFLNRLLSDARTENGRVIDNVLGAAVSGNQSTDTKVSIDLHPSNRTARFDLTLNGHIRSSTVGVTSEATVYTQGNHTFVARKLINFDGIKFTTAPATINVNPHNTTTGIGLNVGGLFSGIAQDIASREVEARRGQAEAIAAQRVRENVLPKFNSEVDKSFAEAGDKLEKEAFSGLKATGLYPDAFTYQSTETTLRMNSRLMAAGELGGDLPTIPVIAQTGATLLLHETAINNAIDRMELAGITVTEPELREKLEVFFSKALNKKVKLDPPPKPAGDEKPAEDEDSGPSAIIFAKTDPMRVRFDDGQLVLVIRAGFKQEGKDDIPAREITVPITFAVKDKKIIVTRGAVRVVAAEEGGGIAINGVVRKKIQSALPDREADGKVELKGPKNTVVTHVTAITVLDGWVHISVN